MLKRATRIIHLHLEEQVPVAPLVVFRIAFGFVMLISTIRYMAMGWVEDQLIDPVLHFHYFGFDWVKPLPGQWIYLVFFLLILSSLGIMLGKYYRIAAISFFLCFTYVELIDITYYLNHYYFVSIISFLLILVPANRYYSLDAINDQSLRVNRVNRWCIDIFKIQIAIVYIYAGLAKINYDWLVEALPLSIWLPAKTDIPFIGFLFGYEITPFLFSWLGMIFDTFIIMGLLWRRTRWFAYFAVVIFHTVTGILFQIGIFPVVMIFAVTIFFSADFHEKVIRLLPASKSPKEYASNTVSSITRNHNRALVYSFLVVFFLFQLLFPWRYLLYPGNVFWTEEGYRFSWRVMLMEKAGTATFFVRDGNQGREGSVINSQFLNDHQEKQMAMQPDLILQFAHYLDDYFRKQGMEDPQVRAEVLVTLNARPARYLIDPKCDLTQISDGWGTKRWIMPFQEEGKQ